MLSVLMKVRGGLHRASDIEGSNKAALVRGSRRTAGLCSHLVFLLTQGRILLERRAKIPQIRSPFVMGLVFTNEKKVAIVTGATVCYVMPLRSKQKY
jgi:hypothetical protein